MKKYAFLVLGGLFLAQVVSMMPAQAENTGYERAQLLNQQKQEVLSEHKTDDELARDGKGPHDGYERAYLENQQKREALMEHKTDDRLFRLNNMHR